MNQRRCSELCYITASLIRRASREPEVPSSPAAVRPLTSWKATFGSIIPQPPNGVFISGQGCQTPPPIHPPPIPHPPPHHHQGAAESLEALQLLLLVDLWISVDLRPLKKGASICAVATFLSVCVLRGGGADGPRSSGGLRSTNEQRCSSACPQIHERSFHQERFGNGQKKSSLTT